MYLTKNPIRDQQERNALAIKHYGLIKKRVIRYFFGKEFVKRYYSVSDAYNDAYIGLLCACEMYDERKGYKFSVYAWKWMAVKMIRGEKKAREMIHIPEHITNLEISITYDENLELYCKQINKNQTELSEIIEDLLTKIHPTEANIIRMRMKGKTHRQISREIGINTSKVSTLERAAHRKIKHYLIEKSID